MLPSEKLNAAEAAKLESAFVSSVWFASPGTDDRIVIPSDFISDFEKIIVILAKL